MCSDYKIKILLVEEDDLYLKLFSSIISQIPDTEIYSADTPALASEIALKIRPDILITDFSYNTAAHTFRMLKTCMELNSSLISIAVTEAYGKGIENEILLNGFTCYIRKPIHIRRFYRIVNHYIQTLINVGANKTCENSCKSKCTLTHKIYDIKDEKDILSLGKCITKFFNSSEEDNTQIKSKLNLLYDVLYCSVNAGLNLRIIFYVSRNYIACLFNTDDIVNYIVKNSSFYSCLSSNVHFSKNSCAIVFSGQFKTIPEKHSQRELTCRMQEHKDAENFVSSLNIEQYEDIDLIIEYTDAMYSSVARFSKDKTALNMQDIMQCICGISKKLSYFADFKTICESLNYLTSILERIKNKRELLNEPELTQFLFAVNEEIINFTENIFIKKDARNIKYLNDSILASVLQFEFLLEDRQELISSNIEFF